MVVESELREQIARVARGEVSLVDLYRWLVARNWNILRNSAAGAIDLAGDVEEVLAAWSDGLQSESQAIRSLAALLAIPARHNVWLNANVQVIVSLKFDPEPQPHIVNSTSTQTVSWFQPVLAEL